MKRVSVIPSVGQQLTKHKTKQAVYFLCIRFCALLGGADTDSLLSSLLILVSFCVHVYLYICLNFTHLYQCICVNCVRFCLCMVCAVHCGADTAGLLSSLLNQPIKTSNTALEGGKGYLNKSGDNYLICCQTSLVTSIAI